jgi:hypothetical protein
MRVRVTRSVQVKPDKLYPFLELSLKAAHHVTSRTKIEPDVFWVRHGAETPTDVMVFMDFDSLAQYEKLFLEGLLRDKDYLSLAEDGADMVRREPRDSLLVLMDKDDFFMNMKDAGKAQAAATPPRGSTGHKRYRLCRHVDVPTGKLRDYMKYAFAFIDDFEKAAKFRPELYCTRFTQERIGCSKMFFDFDECPMCGPALLQDAHTLATHGRHMTEGAPMDELYMRVTAQDLAFDLKSASP